MQLCGSLSILWHCLSLGLECKLTFSSPVATAEFSKFACILSAALSQQIDRETMETVRDFNFGGSKITADGDCSHEIKRCLTFGRKAMTNLESILKSRDITLPTKIHLVKAMVFPVVMYECESWTIKKAECQGIDGFELWC